MLINGPELENRDGFRLEIRRSEDVHVWSRVSWISCVLLLVAGNDHRGASVLLILRQCPGEYLARDWRPLLADRVRIAGQTFVFQVRHPSERADHFETRLDVPGERGGDVSTDWIDLLQAVDLRVIA
jgi:hypothetical protein